MVLCKARASIKINLFLHVIAKQPDGFHRLQSAFLFLPEGDEVLIQNALDDAFYLEGPEAAGLNRADENILHRAKQWFFEWLGEAPQPLHITLTKNIPVASGVGGGSADAAALLYLLAKRYGIAPEQHDDFIHKSGILGADVPVCLAHQLGRGRLFFLDGSGKSEPPTALPNTLFQNGSIVLMNPGHPRSTADAFAQLQTFSAPLPNDLTTSFFKNTQSFHAFLTHQHNDFEGSAIAHYPPLQEALRLMKKTAPLARLSGTGLTCWAWVPSKADAVMLAQDLKAINPNAWIRNVSLQELADFREAS